MKPTIIKGEDFSLSVQIGTEPYAERLQISASSTANPSVITTELPHQLTTGDKVRISAHRKNTIVNGTFTATVIDSFTFSVPVAGAVAGEATGYVTKLSNISLYTFSIAVKNFAGGTAVSGVTASATVTDGTKKILTIAIAKASTALLPSKSCTLVLTYVDDAGETHIILIDCDVLNA